MSVLPLAAVTFTGHFRITAQSNDHYAEPDGDDVDHPHYSRKMSRLCLEM
jgi:hypothetical protein